MEKNENYLRVSIAENFSVTPGGRYRDEGDFSGEEFRDDILEPILRMALEKGKKLIVILDGTIGFSTGFLEESFGGLVRICGYDPKLLLKTMDLVSEEEPYLKEDVIEYISQARKGQKA